MSRMYQRLQRQRHGGEVEGGFTLIELLIVIVVLGILAAIVVFALGGVTGKSTAAACQSDAKTVGVATAALMAENPSVTTLTSAGTVAGDWEYALTSLSTATGVGVTGGPFLQTWPNSSSYTVSVASTGSTANTITSATSGGVTTYTVGAKTPNGVNYGDVLVTGTAAASSTDHASVSFTYDATANPIEACNFAVLGKQ